MQNLMKELAAHVQEDLQQVTSKQTLSDFWQKYLSKNGQVPALMKNLRSVPADQRPQMGKLINELKNWVQAQ